VVVDKTTSNLYALAASWGGSSHILQFTNGVSTKVIESEICTGAGEVWTNESSSFYSLCSIATSKDCYSPRYILAALGYVYVSCSNTLIAIDSNLTVHTLLNNFYGCPIYIGNYSNTVIAACYQSYFISGLKVSPILSDCLGASSYNTIAFNGSGIFITCQQGTGFRLVYYSFDGHQTSIGNSSLCLVSNISRDKNSIAISGGYAYIVCNYHLLSFDLSNSQVKSISICSSPTSIVANNISSVLFVGCNSSIGASIYTIKYYNQTIETFTTRIQCVDNYLDLLSPDSSEDFIYVICYNPSALYAVFRSSSFQLIYAYPSAYSIQQNVVYISSAGVTAITFSSLSDPACPKSYFWSASERKCTLCYLGTANNATLSLFSSSCKTCGSGTWVDYFGAYEWLHFFFSHFYE